MRTVTSLHNDKIKHIKKLLADKDYRYEQKEFVVEGLRALDNIKDVNELFLREGARMPDIKCQKTYVLGEKTFNSISSTENSQGVIAIAGLNILGMSGISKDSRYVLLDRIQDPGNMGTIIRTACAFGFKGVMYTAGCVDPFSPKVARAAASALWKIDIIRFENIDELSPFTVIAADTDGSDAAGFLWPQGFLLAIGNEASGLSQEIKQAASAKLRIPISAEMESLNASVSAGVFMYLSMNIR